MLIITVLNYIKDYREEIGTSKKYAYERNMLITGMLVSGCSVPARVQSYQVRTYVLYCFVLYVY